MYQNLEQSYYNNYYDSDEDEENEENENEIENDEEDQDEDINLFPEESLIWDPITNNFVGIPEQLQIHHIAQTYPDIDINDFEEE